MLNRIVFKGVKINMKSNFIVTAVLCLLLLMTACSPAESATSKQDYSLDANTGIADVDAVLSAAASGNAAELRSLVRYTSAPCTNADGLGGPPKCRVGEAEGAVSSVLPFLGGEGSFIREEEITSWAGVDAVGLYAIYRVAEKATMEEYYPRGNYAVVLKTSSGEAVSLRVADGGIVRVDYLFLVTQDSLEALVEQDASEVILAPKVE